MGVFAERLKEAMTTRKMTQLQLAATVGLGKSSISQYLSGRNIPNTLNLKQIANALDVSADWLNGKDEEMNPIRNLRVADAAKLMGVGCQYIRQGLKNSNLPFGCAVKMPKGKYRYYISPKRFTEFTGIEV